MSMNEWREMVEWNKDSRIRTHLRRLAGAANAGARPVHVVPGDSPPTMRGRGYYYTTPSGKTIVRHPNAYGWPTRYWPSSRSIEVGVEWLEKNALSLALVAS